MIIVALSKNNARVWYISPTYKQSKEICFKMLKDLLPKQLVKKINISELKFDLFNGSEIALKGADQEDALKGVGLDFAVMDEFASMRRDAWYEEIRPTLSDTGGGALFIGTPKGRNHFYDLFIKDDEDWQSFKFDTSKNPYIPAKEIEQVKKDLSERLFKQEYGSEFLADDYGVFKGIRRCIVGKLEEPVLGRFYVIGVDLAKTMDWTVLTVVDSVTRHVVHMQRFQDVPWREQTIKIQQLAHEYNNAMCIVDSTGVGDPVFEDLCSLNISCDGYKFTSNAQKAQLVENMQIAIERRQVTFPQALEILIDELLTFEYTLSDHGNIRYSAPDGKHDDCVISLGLALWGIRNQLHEAQVMSAAQERPEFENRQGMGRVVHQTNPGNPMMR